MKTKAKEVVEKTVVKTAKYSISFIRWVFFFLVLYISVVTAWGYFVSGDEFVQNIATLSVGGFWAFFFGYFGWRMGESLEKHFSFRRNK
jgi:hypothetical protein